MFRRNKFTRMDDYQIQKDPQKRTVLNKYRPITCLPMMWKISIAQIEKEVYYSLISRGLFPKEQKGYHKGTIITGVLLYSDQHTLKENKTRWKNVARMWIDSKNVYNMVPQNWIIDCLKMYQISDKVIKFIEKNGKYWRLEKF